MDQEDTMDFKALRAKFQEEEQLLLRLPGTKPVLPGKPQSVPPPPPQSPTYHLPAGARPSILTSINQSLTDGGRGVGAPKVVFKEDKKDGWKPLTTPKTKEKSEAKPKAGKEKDSKSSKGSKEKLGDEDQDPLKGKTAKDKKGLLHFMTKETPELVPATPPPKSTVKKMVFPGFKKSSKRGSVDMNPILDAPSPDLRSGLPPLIPTASAPSAEAPGAAARALTPGAPFVPAIPDYNAMAALMPPTFIPVAPPAGPAQPPPTDNAPAHPAARRPEADPPSEVAATTTTPAPAVPASSRPATPATPVPVRPSTPIGAPPSGSPPPPPRPGRAVAAAAEEEVDHHHHAETPPPTAVVAAAAAPAEDTVSVASASSSPKAERPASALSSALERAAEKTTGKKSTPADQRILKALEKARRKTASPVTPYLMTPTPGEFDLPPMDHEGPRNPEVNGVENSVPEEGPDMPPLMVVPPPPPRRSLPDPQVLGPPPQKPAKPPSVNLTPYLPPPLEVKEIPTPLEFLDEGDASEGLPESDDAQSPELHSPPSSEFAWPSEDYDHAPNGHPPVDTPPDAGNPAGAYGPPGSEVGAPGTEVGAPAFQEVPEATRGQDELDVAAQRSGWDSRRTSTLQINPNPHFGNVYEDVNVSGTKKKVKVEGLKKRKGPPKNPYDDAPQPTSEEKSKIGRIGNFRSEKKATPEKPDEKELKKKEKQRLEKEKKEQKEQREKEKREQKEKEKRENDMKKKFNITGQEEAMYQALVTVTTKGNKNDLPVTSGENVSIIRTTKCPKGKWLARNSSNTYGYISVDHVKLDIKEMMEMGRRTTTSNPISGSSVLGGEASSMSSRHSSHYPQSTGSFTDDSDEWTGDEDDNITLTDSEEPSTPQGHIRAQSMPDSGNTELRTVPQQSHSDIITDPPMQARHEALHKLATFFQSPKSVAEEPTASTQEETRHTSVDEETVSSPEKPPAEEVNGDISDMLILPPPELYADTEPELSP